jgi:hypothetical protein
MEKFNSNLTKKICSKEEYERALKIWIIFKCKTMKDFLRVYLKSDVMLLTDVFNTFRTKTYESSKLDIAKYVSLPGHANDDNFKSYGKSIELISNGKMYSLVDNHNIRGGFCGVIRREIIKHIIACILGIDANALYSRASLMPVPIGDYKEEDIKDFTKEYILNLDNSDDAPRGYILEVDLSFPKHLHKYFSDLPPIMVHKTIEEKDLSEHTKELLLSQNRKFTPDVKLVATLEDVKNYSIHFNLLKFLLQKGVELVKVHYVFSFKQEVVFKNFIERMAEERKQCDEKGDKIGKTISKLRANAAIGKTMENIANRVNIKIMDDEKMPNYVYRNQSRIHEVFNFIEKEENIEGDESTQLLTQNGHYGVVLPKIRAKLTSPKQIAFTILDNAKLLLYKFHYDVMKVYYPGNASKLIYTDTDSLIYQVLEPNINNVYTKLKDHMDLSNLGVNHPCYDKTNQMKLGYMKSIMDDGEEIDNILCLAPKVYMINNKDKKAKGVVKASLDKDIKEKDYKDALHNNKVIKINQLSFKADKIHNIKTITTNKIALSSFDNKRWHLNNKKSYPYGHYKIKKWEKRIRHCDRYILYVCERLLKPNYKNDEKFKKYVRRIDLITGEKNYFDI